MILFGWNDSFYGSELSKYGVTYCDACVNSDCLIVAPKLKGNLSEIDLVDRRESPVEMLDHLFIGDELVGVSYSFLSAMLIHYMNGYVPAALSVSYLTYLFTLGLNDPQGRRVIDEEEVKAATDIYEAAYDLIAGTPPLPPVIIQRMRAYINSAHAKEVLH